MNNYTRIFQNHRYEKTQEFGERKACSLDSETCFFNLSLEHETKLYR